jgi:heme O synthase-like polyprenyltransferase
MINTPLESTAYYMEIIIYTALILLLGYCSAIYAMTKVCLHLWFVNFNLKKFKTELSNEDYTEFANYVSKMIELNKVIKENKYG